MLKISLYSKLGKESSQVALPKTLAEEGSLNLLAQVKHIYQDRQHRGTKSAKTRAQVNITKKKIYKQKGTGGARHGAASAPIFVGGGVAHGPKSIKRILKLPTKLGRKATKVALNFMSKSGAVVALEGLGQVKKTNEAAKLLKSVKDDKKVKMSAKTVLVLSESTKNNFKYFRNLPFTSIVSIKNLNAYDLLNSTLIVLDADLLKVSKK